MMRLKMIFCFYKHIRLLTWCKLILLCVLCAQNPIICRAQISQGGFPLPEQLFEENRLRSSSASNEIPFIEMPAFDQEELEREDSLPGNRIGGIRFAYKFNVSISSDNAGLLQTLPDGTKVWRVGIRSEGAYSLNILFSEFLLPPGAKIFVYSPDRNTILGAFTEANNTAEGILPIAPIDGDEIIVEYIEPADAPFSGKVRIGDVNHDYRSLRALPGFEVSMSCQVNATCNDIHPDQRRSACLIVVDGTEYCSGNLVNNTSGDGTPYLLTAAHCLFDKKNNFIASKAASSVFFFNYETPYCFADIQGSMEMSLSGASVQASYAKRDMLLLRLNDIPPPDYRTYYAGWNATENISAPAYCFHHPGGDIKKISIENDVPYAASFTYNGTFLTNGHWQVDRWDQGLVEGGSSGSGLFDAENRIIGNLTGGYADVSCAVPGYDDFYRLSVVWNSSTEANKNLKPWLDSQNTGYGKIDGKDSYTNPCFRVSNWQSGEDLQSGTSPNGYAAGHNNLGITEFAEKFSIEKDGFLYGIYFLPQKGLYSASSPIMAQIYSGNESPETLLHEQVVKITTAYYSGGQFRDENLAYFREKENYLRFSEPVSVGSSFFVVFKIPEVPVDTFALYYTTERNAENSNTAWIKYESEWKPFTENPLHPYPASLMIDAVVRFSDSSDIESPSESCRKTEIYPNPTTDELTIRFASEEQPVEIRVSDLSGRVLYVKKNLPESSFYSFHTEDYCGKGVFFLHVIYSGRKDVLKFIKL